MTMARNTSSAGIDGCLTSRQGTLDESGYAAIPCPTCVETMKRKLRDG